MSKNKFLVMLFNKTMGLVEIVAWRMLKYKWACPVPGCRYRTVGSDGVTIMESMDEHNRTHHG